MTVRQSLLAILDQGPCYGYQLRAEFERRTGSAWPLNVGQIYNTLDRLERDGLVAKGDADAEGHVFYEITDAGSREVDAWLADPAGGAPARDDLAIKIAVAATLPGVDVTDVLAAERRQSQSRLDALRRLPRPIAETEAEALAREIVTDAKIARAEAELRFLDRAAERIAERPAHTMALRLSSERPKRGRPAKAPAA
ncbi:PadR family transcriptional regulator [Microbacterium lacus]|uniref:Helix-turn-helix transcriptional regulator n=1 Tax=Microbacterium lacus TaxID=415217 RepID=A0ABP4SA49_9MICO